MIVLGDPQRALLHLLIEARAGCVDASLPLSAASAEVKLCWLPVPMLWGSYRDVEGLLAEPGMRDGSTHPHVHLLGCHCASDCGLDCPDGP